MARTGANDPAPSQAPDQEIHPSLALVVVLPCYIHSLPSVPDLGIAPPTNPDLGLAPPSRLGHHSLLATIV